MAKLDQPIRILAVLVAAIFCFASQARAGTSIDSIVNGGFESGELTPDWFQDRMFIFDPNLPTEDWQATTEDSFTGMFSAKVLGNFELRQDFAAFSSSDPGFAIEASFAIKHPDPGTRNLFVSVFYDDGTESSSGTGVLQTTTTDWEVFDFSFLFEPNKMVTGFSIFGNDLGPTFLDDVVLRKVLIPEPESLLLLLGSLATLLILRRRR